MLKHTCKYLLLLFLILSGCSDADVAPQQPLTLEEEQLLLGNPSEATTSESNYNNFLMLKPQYTLSYSRDRGTPNWVSWHVSREWMGNAARQDNFRSDPKLPEGWYRVTASSYSGSGFDRGHNTPSADRTSSEEDNSATFLMTNMIPQAPKNNQEAWANLEDYTRDLVQDGMEVYVVMGSYGEGGTGSNGSARTIDQGRVTVPSRIWKVLVVLQQGDDDLQRITFDTRVIAVDVPNTNTVRSDWGSYRTTVDAIESATGYDLLSALPAQLQQVLEGRTDTGPVK
ncbi:DNA/RNA non-specific endonuclease [Pontibacter saemangeumensis]|uniref:DNA/RNA non-specific endonuclease n=1 Tax=Pontibacter saemangeumensis TaxID=1084525 RepID=UPI0031EDDF1F